MKNNKTVIYVSALASVCVVIALFLMSPWSLSLKKVHFGIEKEFQNVQHIDARSLSEMDTDDIVIFDVRELNEHQVSHIKSAIQVNPDINSDEFKAEFSSLIAEKVVIFYCSVGVRSSALASRLESILSEAQVSTFYNLKGGLFQWHNELRPLVNTKETSTEDIHPYNDYWGKLIEDKLAISYF